MQQVVAVVGPTAVGKTAIAVELAQTLGAEIVSCDSMQVYRRMPVLSQAPSHAQRHLIPHHLVECVDPTDLFSVGDYQRLAAATIQAILERGKGAVIVGGTGLYLGALTKGLCKAPPADQGVRQRLWDECRARGSTDLHNRLQGVDATAALRIHPHDVRRIIRALEVYALTGKPLSRWWKEEARQGCADVLVIGVHRDRDALYQRINERVTHMVYEGGAINEARTLLQLPLSKTARQVHGLRLIERYLAGLTSLKETVVEWQQLVRNYARRQLAWFRQTPGLIWVQAQDDERPWQIAERLREVIRRGAAPAVSASRSDVELSV